MGVMKFICDYKFLPVMAVTKCKNRKIDLMDLRIDYFYSLNIILSIN